MNHNVKKLRILLSLSSKEVPLKYFEDVLGPSKFSYNLGDLNESITFKKVYCKSTCWALIEESDDLVDTHDLIDALFSEAYIYKDKILSLAEVAKPRFLIWIRTNDTGSVDDNRFGFFLSTEQISFLNSISADIDVDVI